MFLAGCPRTCIQHYWQVYWVSALWTQRKPLMVCNLLHNWAHNWIRLWGSDFVNLWVDRWSFCIKMRKISLIFLVHVYQQNVVNTFLCQLHQVKLFKVVWFPFSNCVLKDMSSTTKDQNWPHCPAIGNEDECCFLALFAVRFLFAELDPVSLVPVQGQNWINFGISRSLSHREGP